MDVDEVAGSRRGGGKTASAVLQDVRGVDDRDVGATAPDERQPVVEPLAVVHDDAAQVDVLEQRAQELFAAGGLRQHGDLRQGQQDRPVEHVRDDLLVVGVPGRHDDREEPRLPHEPDRLERPALGATHLEPVHRDQDGRDGARGRRAGGVQRRVGERPALAHQAAVVGPLHPVPQRTRVPQELQVAQLVVPEGRSRAEATQHASPHVSRRDELGSRGGRGVGREHDVAGRAAQQHVLARVDRDRGGGVGQALHREGATASAVQPRPSVERAVVGGPGGEVAVRLVQVDREPAGRGGQHVRVDGADEQSPLALGELGGVELGVEHLEERWLTQERGEYGNENASSGSVDYAGERISRPCEERGSETPPRAP